MNLTKTKKGTTVIISIDGRIDTNTAMEFGEQVNDALDNIENLILDFSNVEYISSLGLRAILPVWNEKNKFVLFL